MGVKIEECKISVRRKYAGNGNKILKIFKGYWDFNMDEEGNISDIEFSIENARFDEKMLELVSVYIQDGSYIQICAKDGSRRRWTFNGGKYKECEVEKRMSYCMNMEDSLIFIKTEDVGKVLKIHTEFRGSYNFEQDEDGNITGIEFLGEKLGSDKEMFSEMAPYIKNGSYIQMRGEDGLQWRWIFKDGCCVEYTAKTVWQDEAII